MVSANSINNELLRAHCCLEAVDYVAGDPETTAFKRRARLQQALWRESRGLSIGTQPMRPSPDRPSRPIGSRIALDIAKATGANFLSGATWRAVQDRVASPQPYQTLDADRLYCDLLSSMPMCFNLFAALQADLALAVRAVHTWWQMCQDRSHRFFSSGRQGVGYRVSIWRIKVRSMLRLSSTSAAADEGFLGLKRSITRTAGKKRSPRTND